MGEKEMKSELARSLAESVKLKAEVEVYKELAFELIKLVTPSQEEALKDKAGKDISKMENHLKNSFNIEDHELNVLFLREFFPYKTGS